MGIMLHYGHGHVKELSRAPATWPGTCYNRPMGFNYLEPAPRRVLPGKTQNVSYPWRKPWLYDSKDGLRIKRRALWREKLEIYSGITFSWHRPRGGW